MTTWIASLFGDTTFGTTDFLILLAGVAYLVNQLIESKGWSRSSKRLRVENDDLVRRNLELEQQVGRHEESITQMRIEAAKRQSSIENLMAKVSDLELQSQEAVLERLVEVEVKADARHSETLNVLQKIAVNTSHA